MTIASEKGSRRQDGEHNKESSEHRKAQVPHALRTEMEDFTMAKTLIAFFSRADENYFGGADGKRRPDGCTGTVF